MKKTIALIITLVITLSAALTGCGYTYKELNLRAKFDQSLKGTTLTVYNVSYTHLTLPTTACV